MNNMVDQARQVMDRLTRPVRRWPLLYRTLHLMLALTLYATGILAVDAVSGEARMPVLLFLVFFLPGVLHVWLQLYWQVRRDLRALRQRLHDVGAH